MNILFKQTLLSFFFGLLFTPAAIGQIYVSLNGDDANSGTKASPVRTLERALLLSRPAKDRQIVLRGGTHRLTQRAENGAALVEPPRF